MRPVIIINPVSGRHTGQAGRAADRLDQARRLLDRTGLSLQPSDVDIELTRARGHGAELAESAVARGAELVVAWGGDGTVNEIAGPLIGTRTALGIVPVGSGNGLARGLGLPLEPQQALRIALAGQARAIDAGLLGRRHFLNIGGIGFDAAVARSFDRRGTRGLMSYVRSALAEVWTYRPERYRVELDDGVVFAGEYQMVAFANAREYGNRLVLDPAADPEDGRLNVVIVDAGPAWRQVWRARRLAFPSVRPAEGVHRRTAASVSVTADRLRCHVDGEPFDTTGTLEVGVRPKALLVSGAQAVNTVRRRRPGSSTAEPVASRPAAG